MAAATSEVDDVIRDLKKINGFSAYLILNNDGIVIKYENMSYRTAVHHAHLVLSLCSKASKYMRDLNEGSAHDNKEVESIRMITKDYEMVIAQHGNFTLVATHSKIKEQEVKKEGVEGEVKKEGEPEKKESA